MTTLTGVLTRDMSKYLVLDFPWQLSFLFFFSERESMGEHEGGAEGEGQKES